MKKKNGAVKKSFKSLVNIRRWVAWDEITTGGKVISSSIRELLTLHTSSSQNETFEQVVDRLGLTEQDLKQHMRVRLHLAIIYLLMTIALFIYMVYAFVKSFYLTGFICTALTALLLVYAFREHFWYTQIKHHRFGCTFKEWLRFTLNIKVKK